MTFIISEKERQEISKEAKKIMDDFADMLDRISDINEKDIVEIKGKSFREENEKQQGNESSDDFKKRILDNASKKDKNHIIAEKGGWLE